jgi:hypothetical protein
MRFRLTATVEGDSVTDATFDYDAGDYRLGVVCAEDGRVTAVWADCPVPEYAQWLPAITSPAGTIPRITFHAPPEQETLLSTLQYVESLGSFWLGITKVAWSEAERSWIPESPLEEAEIAVSSITMRWEYPGSPVPISRDLVIRLLKMRERLDYLVVPMSFYREGVNEYQGHRYVSAFYNFYFFLEDLYGTGKTKNRQVLDAFRQSPQLMAALREAYALFQRGEADALKADLAELAGQIGCDFSADGMAEFLVMMRGELHHFSQRSSRPKGHPLNQHRFRAVAYFAMTLCVLLIQQLANGDPIR